MLKVIAAATFAVCATAASAATLTAPVTGSDAHAFHQAHAERYLLGKNDVDVYVDTLDGMPAYMFLQHDAAGKINGSVWIMQGPQGRVSKAYAALKNERATVADVETHDIDACTSLGGRAFRALEKHVSSADGAVTMYNSTPSFSSVAVETGTGISGQLKPLDAKDFASLLDSANTHLTEYEKKWEQLFKAETISQVEVPSLPTFCDTKPFNWPTSEKLPLALGQPLLNAGSPVADGTSTLTGSYPVFGATLTKAEVKVSARKLASASYEGDNIPETTFASISKTLATQYGEPYIKDHATRGAAVTDTLAYQDTASHQTVLVVQLLKRNASDTTGQLRVATRLP